MKKETFVKAINSIEKQINYDISVSKALGKAFPNAYEANLLQDNHFILDMLIKILEEETNDTKDGYGQSWIEWFCFETNFGKKSNGLKAYDENENPIPMNNAEELYDFLVSCH